MGELLVAHQHFNYTSNLIQAIICYVKNKNDVLRGIAVDHLSQVLKNDKDGQISLEVRKFYMLRTTSKISLFNRSVIEAK